MQLEKTGKWYLRKQQNQEQTTRKLATLFQKL